MPARDNELDAAHLPHAALIANDENGRLHFVPHFIPSNISVADSSALRSPMTGKRNPRLQTPDSDFPRNIHRTLDPCALFIHSSSPLGRQIQMDRRPILEIPA